MSVLLLADTGSLEVRDKQDPGMSKLTLENTKILYYENFGLQNIVTLVKVDVLERRWL